MKEAILSLIKEKPKHYSLIIKSSPDMLEWVKQNSIIVSEYLPEMVYSALYGVDNICINGKHKKFVNITQGFSGCGPAKTCKCTSDSIRQSVIETKSKFTTSKRKEINEKRKTTMIDKYGVAYNSQRDDIHHIWKKPKINSDAFEKLSNYDWLNQEYNQNKRTAVDIANELGVYYSTVIDYCIQHNFTIRQRTNYSLVELNIMKFLDDHNVQYEQGNWKAIGKELDIYIPSKNMAIEANGLYWHSYHPRSNKPENKTRHLEKSQLSAKHGIDLIHITDFEWNNKREIIQAMLLSKLGKNTRIGARQCTIRELSSLEEKEFINRYHIQGYIPSNFSIGLFYKNDLVSLMSVGKSRFNNEAEYELLRYCTKAGLTVVGGGSKLISAIKDRCASIITYCDLSKSTGSSYVSIGFKFLRDTGPGYFWTDGNIVISRFKAQRSQLKRWLETYDPNLSESENMFLAKFRRFHDCGNRVFIIK
jgi:hypothetical protein